MDVMQLSFNIGISLIGFLGGWVLKSTTKRIDNLEEDDDILKSKLQAVELLVVGGYVGKADLEKFSQAVFKKLDKLEDRLMTARPLVVQSS